jgi:gliding motility-associated protein GldC
MLKESQINLFISVDDKKLTEKIEWQADEAGFEGRKESQTVMLSLWDRKERMTYIIDLWTKDMSIEDMQIHFYQMFLKMANTFERSTLNSDVAGMIRNFSSDFANRLGIKDIHK